MSRKLFGTDGVRGVANLDPMTAETALKLGRALAHVSSSRHDKRHRILVGKDTRASGYMLETALCAGICSAGADVLLVGPMPTPGIAFLTADMRCDAGAVISAYHNPFQDNGIKFFSRDGIKLSHEDENQIEEFFFSNGSGHTPPTADNIGRAIRIDDALGRYVVFLKSAVPKETSFEGIRIVLDCANGAAYKAAPLVFEELGSHVHARAVNPDGTNINENCGSLHPEAMCKEVRRVGAHVGIALDGDADRAIFADEGGREVDGDQIMGLIARDMIDRGTLRRNTLVATVMSNMGLEVAMKEMGGALVRTPVGDRYVVERMRTDGYNFGGEQSGHLIFLDRNTSGDGILSALQVLDVMVRSGKPLSELASAVTKFPQVLRNVEVRQRKDLRDVPEVDRIIRESENRLGHKGRLLVRYSGTQPLCRVMAEGEDETEVRAVVETVCDAIARYI